MKKRFHRLVAGAAVGFGLLALLAGCNGTTDPTASTGQGATTASAKVMQRAAARWTAYDRPADYPKTVTVSGLKIPMSDGVVLAASVMLPADASGQVVPGPWPTVLTQTGYNQNLSAAITANAFLVQRGYAHISVDVRGTGGSEGEWEAFGTREQQDYYETMDWVARQAWSDGKVGTWGPSFMGITQLFTAARQHPAHKAVFAIVPMADAYRDIVFQGGQVNAGFIPLWIGLVTGLGLVTPDPTLSDPAMALTALTGHVLGALTEFQVPILAGALGGTATAYDSPFWRLRSPIEQADKIRIPTFIVGGLDDLFQRGEPLLYEAIRKNATARLLIGPWTHLAGSFGNGLPADGVPDLNHLALQWFDQYVRGQAAGAEAIPAVTQYIKGLGRFVTEPDWPHPAIDPLRLYLRGDRSLSSTAPAAGEASAQMLQQPLGGLCSASTNQWVAGALTGTPCTTDGRIAEASETTYTTTPLDRDLYLNGPIEADLWISTTASDAGVSVRVDDVAPDGSVQNLTNGLLSASMRAMDASRSRLVKGVSLQPWHPFTQGAMLPVKPGEPMLLQVEVFPTSALLRAGHALRISVGPSDFPHGLPPLPSLVNGVLGAITLYSDATHPSSVSLPRLTPTAGD